MEALTGLAVKSLLTLGGGYLLASVFLIFLLHERKDKKAQEERFNTLIEERDTRVKEIAASKDQLYEKLFTVSDKQTEIMTRVNTVLEHNDRTLDNVNGTLNSLLTDNRRRGR